MMVVQTKHNFIRVTPHADLEFDSSRIRDVLDRGALIVANLQHLGVRFAEIPASLFLKGLYLRCVELSTKKVYRLLREWNFAG